MKKRIKNAAFDIKLNIKINISSWLVHLLNIVEQHVWKYYSKKPAPILPATGKKQIARADDSASSGCCRRSASVRQFGGW